MTPPAMHLWCNIITSRIFPFWLPAFPSRAGSPFLVSPSTSAFVCGPREPNRASGLSTLGRWGLGRAPARARGGSLAGFMYRVQLTMISFCSSLRMAAMLPVGCGREAATPPILRLSCGQSARGPARNGFDGLAGFSPQRAKFGDPPIAEQLFLLFFPM